MQFITILAGANFRPAEAKAVLKSLQPGAQLRLERDPANAYDTSAVKVLATIETEGGAADQGDVHREEHFIGFVAKADNYELALLLDGVQDPEADSPLFAEGHTPTVERCEIIDFVSGPLKPTIVIEVSTGWEVGTLVKSDADLDGEDDDFLPEGDE